MTYRAFYIISLNTLNKTDGAGWDITRRKYG